jgi:hypothetical protein
LALATERAAATGSALASPSESASELVSGSGWASSMTAWLKLTDAD